MSGLIGFISKYNLPLDRENILHTMMNSIRHRGPFGDNKAILPTAHFGYLQLFNNVRQPDYSICSADGRYIFLFDGKIFNIQEIIKYLESKKIDTQNFSEYEIIFYLLIEERENALQRLNGMFSFFFYDTETKKWIAARDHFGNKPFYYAETKEEFIFASEIKALLQHPLVNAKRDEFALQQYLTFQFCLGSSTLFEGIKKLEPGHFLLGEGATALLKKCYWDANYKIDKYHTEDYFLDTLRKTLEDSVRLQLDTHKPTGAYLSGGIDSSLICILASKHRGEDFPMYHGRFAEGIEFDESEFAKEVISQTAGSYNEVIPTPLDFVENMPKIIYMLDEPVAGPGVFPQYMVSKLASNDVKIILGGQGGDEIFGGYARYLIGYLEQALKGAIFQTQEEGRHLVTLETIIPNLPVLKEYLPLIRQFWSVGLFEDMDSRYFHLIDRNPQGSYHLTKEMSYSIDKSALFEEFKSIFNNPDTKSYINKMTHFDQKTILQALLQIEDRVSMSFSMESRTPFLDRRIVDLMTTMPPPLKFQGGRTKHIVKKSIGNLLPQKIINRKDKMGFPVPLKQWMQKGPVRDFVSDILLSKRSYSRGIYSREALEGMVTGNSGVGARSLWGALSLELWHRSFIDGK